MAAILSVTTTRVRDGKWEEALAAYGKLKEILQRLGGKTRIITQTSGASPGTVSVVVELASWTEFGAFGEKAEKDSEYQSLVAAIRANPFSDIVQRSISTELDV